MGKYGKYASDGSVETEATECILTGRALNPPYDNTVRYPARGGQFFRILSSQHHRVTDDMMADWKAGKAEESEAESVPAVESFSYAGTSTAEEKARAKRVRESFNESPVIGAPGPVSENRE